MVTRRNRNRRARKERATEQLLALSRIALDSSGQGICIYNADSRVVLFNQRYLDLFNMSADVIRPGVSYREVLAHSASRGNFSPDTVDQLVGQRLALLAKGQPFSTEQLMPSGLIMTLEVRPLPDGGWITVCDDVTGRAKLETALALQTERIEHAVRHMSHGLTMFGPDERLIVCNEQYHRVYGLDPDVVKPGIMHREVISHWVSRGHGPGLSAEVIYNRRMREIRRGEASVGFLTRRDGRIIQAISSPMPGGGWVSTCEDVSERLRHEDELR
jgi:PAS domain-containing protein